MRVQGRPVSRSRLQASARQVPARQFSRLDSQAGVLINISFVVMALAEVDLTS